jgi:hypothetical protein
MCKHSNSNASSRCQPVIGSLCWFASSSTVECDLLGHYVVVPASELHTDSERGFGGYIASKALWRDKCFVWFLEDGKERRISVSKLREWYTEAEDWSWS